MERWNGTSIGSVKWNTKCDMSLLLKENVLIITSWKCDSLNSQDYQADINRNTKYLQLAQGLFFIWQLLSRSIVCVHATGRWFSVTVVSNSELFFQGSWNLKEGNIWGTGHDNWVRFWTLTELFMFESDKAWHSFSVKNFPLFLNFLVCLPLLCSSCFIFLFYCATQPSVNTHNNVFIIRVKWLCHNVEYNINVLWCLRLCSYGK